MTLYNVIYDFFASHVFTSGDLPSCSWTIGGANLALADWLSHTSTIIVLALLIFVAVRFVVWLTKTIGNAMRLA